MFDVWGISIFVGFDFQNVDALRLKSRKELLTLLFRKLLILRIYSIYRYITIMLLESGFSEKYESCRLQHRHE